MTETSSEFRGRIISLEIARFAAALFVGVDHLVAFTASLATGPVLHGFDLPPITSVLLFFVLSGFVIFTAHAQDFGQARRIPRYLWRRFIRIFPLYWLALVLPLYFLWQVSGTGFLINIFTLSPFVNNINEIISPAWSLRFELAFYMMFALCLLPAVGRYILGLWVLLTLWLWYSPWLPIPPLMHILPLPDPVTWHFLGTHEILFFAGLAAGWLYLRWQPGPRILWPLLTTGAVALLLLARLDDFGFAYPPVPRVPLVGASFATVIFSLAALERGGHLRLHPKLGRLGAMSYPFYLFHPVIIFAVSVAVYFHPAEKHLASPAVVFTAMLLAALILTALVTFLFDRPLQKRLRGSPAFFEKKAAKPAASKRL